MKIEIEIKLRLPEDLTEIRNKLRRLRFSIHKRRTFESNILFDDTKRRLRKHGKLLRVRRSGKRGLLTFKGPSQQSRYKKRWEIETEFPDGDVIERLGKLDAGPTDLQICCRPGLINDRLAGAEVSGSALALNPVGSLVNLVSDIAARGEKTSRNQPKNQHGRDPEDE